MVLRVYLDNCVFNRPYDRPSNARIISEANAKMVIQRAIADGRLELSASFMLVTENSRCPNRIAREYNLSFIRSFKAVYVSRREKESFRPLIDEIAAVGIKPADAIHIACAIVSRCDYLITVDDRMLKFYNQRIKIITPTEMVHVMEV